MTLIGQLHDDDIWLQSLTHPTRGRDEMSITITLLFVQVFRDS